MEGSAAFSDMEMNGMHIDVPYLDRIILETGTKIQSMEEALKQDEIFGEWRKMFGERTDIYNRNQLGDVIFKGLKITPKKVTATGKASTDKESLDDVDLPFVRRWMNFFQLQDTRTKFLIGLRGKTVDGICRPCFNLHIATTYRSSCEDPNLQNQPVRDPRQAMLIRRAFIPTSDEYVLVETDYSALEFRGAANFWQDPKMIAYGSDSSLDIHRDFAAEVYDLDLSDVSKPARSCAKNQFVFPILYGSSYVNISKNLWQQIHRQQVKTKAGVPMYEHLESRGIRNFKDYETHCKKVQDKFHTMFPGWSRDRDIWWNKYLERGWFELSTGFVIKGLLGYNNLMNTPIQGPSFHCLLWSLIQINKELKQRKMKSKVICQIHDSIIGDVHRSEIQDYVALVTRVMTQDIRKHWHWIVTPLGVEVELAERNWFEKKPFHLAV